MVEPQLPGSLGRRRLLIAAAAASCFPLAVHAAGICTPHDLAQHYASRVDRRLPMPAEMVELYGLLIEAGLLDYERATRAPQYLLVVDSNPHVQAAFLFWRLMAGSYRFIGASPASTGCLGRPHHVKTPQGLFDQAHRAARVGAAPADRHGRLRVYDFSRQRAYSAAGIAVDAAMHVQARAADAKTQRLLGSAQSDGCILLPPTLIALLDEFGILDGAVTGSSQARAGGQQLPYPGRYLLVVDSEVDERPQWSPLPG